MEQKRMNENSLSQRAGLLSLLLHQTTNSSSSINDSQSTLDLISTQISSNENIKV